MEFHPLDLSDKAELEQALLHAPDRGCEYTFGNLYIWREVYGTKTACSNGFRLIRFDQVTRSYLFPVGEGNLAEVMEELIADAREQGVPFHMVAARREDCDELEKQMPGRFSFHTSRDFAEYVYLSENLIELRGKKYHGKRNHIAKFMAEYPDNCFEQITRENMDEVRAMNEEWYESNTDDSASLQEERTAVDCAMDDFFLLGFCGGLLRAEGRVVAYSMGEPINGGTFCTHIEKALHTVDGAYTVINQRFCERFCRDYRFVNREDDVGDEGLRRSKLSYYPEQVTEKYVVAFRQ